MLTQLSNAGGTIRLCSFDWVWVHSFLNIKPTSESLHMEQGQVSASQPSHEGHFLGGIQENHHFPGASGRWALLWTPELWHPFWPKQPSLPSLQLAIKYRIFHLFLGCPFHRKGYVVLKFLQKVAQSSWGGFETQWLHPPWQNEGTLCLCSIHGQFYRFFTSCRTLLGACQVLPWDFCDPTVS